MVVLLLIIRLLQFAEEKIAGLGKHLKENKTCHSKELWQ